MNSADPFKDYELNRWQEAAQEYDNSFGALTRQSNSAILDAVDAKSGMRLLDIATGPGYLAALAAERGCTATGLDFSPEMIKLAKEHYPTIEFIQGDAEQLPFDEGSFEAVTMNFGILHLGHPEKALAEAFRVLSSAGKIAFTVWDVPTEALGFKIILDAITEFGNMNVQLPPAPPFFRFSIPEESHKVLQEAGFSNSQVKTIPQTWHLPSGEAFFKAFYDGTARTAGLLRAQPSEKIETIKQAIIQTVEKEYTQDGQLQIPMPAIMAFAEKV